MYSGPAVHVAPSEYRRGLLVGAAFVVNWVDSSVAGYRPKHLEAREIAAVEVERVYAGGG